MAQGYVSEWQCVELTKWAFRLTAGRVSLQPLLGGTPFTAGVGFTCALLKISANFLKGALSRDFNELEGVYHYRQYWEALHSQLGWDILAQCALLLISANFLKGTLSRDFN
jgi:hypothetical protein